MEHLFNLSGTPAQEAIEGDGKALLVVRSGVPLHIVYLPDDGQNFHHLHYNVDDAVKHSTSVWLGTVAGETFKAETLMVAPHG